MSYDPDSTAGIPEHGRRRLEQSKRGLFTSDLSVSEFFLVSDIGFDPVGLVIGSSIYHLGFQMPRTGNCELETLSQAMYSARELAMTRMEEEADQDLSGQDFWTLLRSGHRPVGMVMGSCVYHVGHRGFIQATAQTGRNVEMANYTQALYDAGELAMGRMQDEAEQSQAQGIVGVQIQEKNHGWGSHTIEFFAIGTAVIPLSDPVGIPAPTPVISLDN